MNFTINRNIDIQLSKRDISKVLMNWLKENSLATSEDYYDYFVENDALYEGENGYYLRDEAVFITDDKQIVELFNTAKFLAKLK